MDDGTFGPSPSSMVILFDLDNTLFDHFNSLKHAISAVRFKFDYLQEFTTDELIGKYNAALVSSYSAYLRKEITYDDVEEQKVVTFFEEAGFPRPSLQRVREFRDIYRPIYRRNRRATPGSIETLCRLRENGYKLAIITNGQVDDQTAKAECIGVAHLVDHIVTSQEAGVSKPDKGIFQLAASRMQVKLSDMIMVGDSIESDVKGALNAGISPILYSDNPKQNHTSIQGSQVPTIQHMSRLLALLGVPQPCFQPQFSMDSESATLSISNLGIDLITEPRDCLRVVSRQDAEFIARCMGKVAEGMAKWQFIHTMQVLENMMRAIAASSRPIDRPVIRVSYAGRDQDTSWRPMGCQRCEIMTKAHSICAQYTGLSLEVAGIQEESLSEVIMLLQDHSNHLMRDDTRAAIGSLRLILLKTGQLGGIEDVVVTIE